jgi:D-lactate dehydrogenase
MAPLLEKFQGSFFVEQQCDATSAHLCKGANAACLFVNDDCGREVLEVFKSNGIRLVLLRCAGFDRVDLAAAEELGIKVARVPAYSPYAVAEQAVSLVMTLNRRLHISLNRVRTGNYELSGLVGFDMMGKTVGVLGTGRIGQIAAKIFKGFGCRIICYDPYQSDAMKQLGGEYMTADEVYAQADIVTLHLPLLDSTRYMINDAAIAKMKQGVTIVNVSRGGIVDTQALINGLTIGKIRAVGLDVYEDEDKKFFKDFSHQTTQARMQTWDSKLALLRSFHNVLITPHTAFLTYDALDAILKTTILNADEFLSGKELSNKVVAPPAAKTPAPEAAPVPKSKALQARFSQRMQIDPSQIVSPKVAKFEGVANPDFKICIYSAASYVKVQMQALVDKYTGSFFVEHGCNPQTAKLCRGANAVCFFVNDEGSKEIIDVLKAEGVKLILLRCAGFDRVDLKAAEEAGIKVARVPAYSPYAVAEHAVALTCALNRHLVTTYNRVTESNFTISGLVGMDLNGKTCGILGTGKIGQIAAKIFKGFGMDVICYDVYKNDVITKELGCRYAELDDVLAVADVVSLHVPLLESTKYMINEASIQKMKTGVILINVSRGALVHTPSLIDGLISGKIGGVGMDVYEYEKSIFFKNFSEMDYSERIVAFDHDLMCLRSMPNALITPHIAFLTEEALDSICKTTTLNADEFVAKKELTNEVKAPK